MRYFPIHYETTHTAGNLFPPIIKSYTYICTYLIYLSYNINSTELGGTLSSTIFGSLSKLDCNTFVFTPMRMVNSFLNISLWPEVLSLQHKQANLIWYSNIGNTVKQATENNRSDRRQIDGWVNGRTASSVFVWHSNLWLSCKNAYYNISLHHLHVEKYT